MKLVAFIMLCSWLSGCNSPALPYRDAPVRSFPVHFYVENGSETQPVTDLLIKWDTTVVAQDTFLYSHSSDLFDTYTLSAKSGEHRLQVFNTLNHLTRDTTLMVDTLTHVFISFVYTALDTTMLKRIKTHNSPEEQSAVIDALSEPKRLVIFTMRGPISIP